MGGDAFKSLKGRRLLGVAPEDADIDTSVPEVGRDVRTRDRDEADDPRILGRISEERRYLDPDRFGNAVGPARITQKRPPPRSECERSAPSGSTRAHLQPSDR